jgi:hypothetical protein
MMVLEFLPNRYPKRPDPDLSLRVARRRLQVAVLAVEEAYDVDGEDRRRRVILALENIAHAVKALRRG